MKTPIQSLGVCSIVSGKKSLSSRLFLCPRTSYLRTALLAHLFFTVCLLSAQTPNITVRFANPTFDCDTDEYCVDVEFQSDLENQELFGMNVRFFYEDNVLELIDFRDFQGDYDAVDIPTVSTSPPAVGYNWFGFGEPGNGAADFVNGAIQLMNENGTPIYISTSGWTKLFQVCFHIDDPAPDSMNFCPSIVWDLEFDPLNGGYLPGDDGVVITLTPEVPGENIPANEYVEQFNWAYTGDGSAPPYGAPAETDCIDISCTSCPNDFPIVASDTICEGESVELVIEDLYNGLVTYALDFGSGAIPATGTGPGSHIIQYLGTPENESTGASVVLTLSTAGCPDLSEEICKVKVNPYPDATINASTSPGCYYTNRVFLPSQPEIPDATYQWDFGFGAIPPVATGYGPHTVYYDTATLKTVKLLILPNAPGAQCPDSSSITFNITNCPANIVGHVKTTDNQPISGVNLRLYKDADLDGLPDDAFAVRSVYSAANTGNYSMATLEPGNYVIKQVQPAGYSSFDDGDPTPDNDIVANVDSLDNIIPVTLVPSELDGLNIFIEGAAPGMISGYVFEDLNGNEEPDSGEGLPSMMVKLFVDADSNGVADSNTPLDSTLTDENGYYTFINVPVGTYVLMEYEGEDYHSVKDYDFSNDSDDVPNTNTHNDIIPLTVTNAEQDIHNYFIDGVGCENVVINTDDEAFGSFRYVLNCVTSGDTVFFHSSLAGTTITINSLRLFIDKDVVIFSDANPRITLKSIIPGFFEILAGNEVKFVGLDIISGLSGTNGAAFKNNGNLILEDINVYRNPLPPTGDYLIHNASSGELFLEGQCHIEID